VQVVAFDEIVEVMHVVHILVDNVRLKDSSAAWHHVSVVSGASNAAATKATPSTAATATTAVATTTATVAAATAATAPTSMFSLSIDLGHHVVLVLACCFLIFIFIAVFLNLEVLVFWRARIGPEVDNQVLDQETHLVLLFIRQGGEHLGQLCPLELKANISREHHIFCVVLGRGSRRWGFLGRLRGGNLLCSSGIDADCVGTKKSEAGQGKSGLHVLRVSNLFNSCGRSWFIKLGCCQ